MPHTPQSSPAGATIQPATFADSGETADNDWKADSDDTAAVFKAAAPFDQTVPDSPESEAAAPLNQPLPYTGAISPGALTPTFQLSPGSDEDDDDVPYIRASSPSTLDGA